MSCPASFTTTSLAFRPARSAGLPGCTSAIKRAAVVRKAELLGELSHVDGPDDHAQIAADELALLDQAFDDPPRNRRRNGQPDAFVAARLGDDGRIDPDDFRPARLMSGPPEFPGLIAASVWMYDSVFRDPTSFRSVAETIPAVTEWSKPSGLPIARTHSPISSFSESPHWASTVRSALTFSTARSDLGSAPTS